MQIADPAINKRQINNAGDVVRSEDSGRLETSSAFQVIESWRSAHSRPLRVVTMYFSKSRSQGK